jgi:hypothetical protein
MGLTTGYQKEKKFLEPRIDRDQPFHLFENKSIFTDK